MRSCARSYGISVATHAALLALAAGIGVGVSGRVERQDARPLILDFRLAGPRDRAHPHLADLVPGPRRGVEGPPELARAGLEGEDAERLAGLAAAFEPGELGPPLDATALPRTSAITAPGEQGTLAPFLRRPRADALRGTNRPRVGTTPAFAGRTPSRRVSLAVEGGGGPDTERAVEAGLLWLARHQDASGAWGAELCAKRCTPSGTSDALVVSRCAESPVAEHVAGTTALAVLAFLGAGYGPGDRTRVQDELGCRTLRYGDSVLRGLRFLSRRQKPGGWIAEPGSEAMYDHALATIALCEATAMSGGPAVSPFGRAARGAVRALEAARNPGLAWRYTPRCGQNDSSVTGMCLMAIRAARVAGIETSPDSLAGARAWLGRVSSDSGSVGYTSASASQNCVPGKNEAFSDHPAMEAIAIFAATFEPRPEPRRLAKTVARILADLPSFSAGKSTDAYYWYNATVALYQWDGPAGPSWRRWSPSLARAVLAGQRSGTRTCLDGSWDAVGVDHWTCFAGGKPATTAMNVLTLEVFYRYPSAFGGERHR